MKFKKSSEYEFLPGILEIEETPPSPLGRFVIWTILCLIVLFVAWSFLAKTDKVAIARGKIIPAGKAKVIEPLEEGIVREILVKEGDRVKKGQLLVKLDPTLTSSDVTELNKTLSFLKFEHYLFGQSLKYVDAEELSNIIKISDYKALTSSEIEFYLKLQKSKLAEYKHKISTQNHIIIQAKAEHKIAKTQLVKLKKKFESLSNEETMLEKLAQKGGVSKREWHNKESDVETLGQEIISQEIEIEKSLNKQQEAEDTLIIIEKQWNNDNLTQLVESEKKIATTEQQLVKAKRKLELTDLYSPVDGTINQMEVTTIGETVAPTQAIISIIPDNMPLIAEAMVLNRDIGFIRCNQRAELKMDTFQFNKYGVLEGEVINISPDATLNQQTGEQEYKIQIRPDKISLVVENYITKITPGMTLTAEIKTGTRRIIEFFVDPVTKFQNEGFKLR